MRRSHSRTAPWAAAATLLLVALPAPAAELVREVTSSPRRWEGTGTPQHLAVAVVDAPKIRRRAYALRGTVRYQGVTGTAYLEMWSLFPGGGRYFSRTLAAAGPMAKLTGSSPKRPFVLPFVNRAGGPPPSRLTVNLFLPGKGTITVGPMYLIQLEPGEDPLGPLDAWWGPRAGGLLGAVAGSLLGALGALLGWLIRTGRARRLVLGLLAAVAAAGAASLVAGLVALSLAQPYAVTFPLLLLGLLGTVLPLLGWRAARTRYQRLELRRMEALDAG